MISNNIINELESGNGLTQILDIGIKTNPGGLKSEEMSGILEKMGVPPARVRYALTRNKLTGEHISQIMRDFCFLSAENVAKALSIQANMEYFPEKNIEKIDPSNFDEFKQNLPYYQGFVPIHFSPPHLVLAVSDAANISLAANKFYDYKTRVVIASEITIQQVYRKFFASTEAAFDTYLDQYIKINESKNVDLESQPGLLRDIVGSLLRHACTLKVSDIHMHMTEYIGLIKLTIDGSSFIFRSIPKDLYNRVLTKLMTDARVKIEDLRGGMKEASVEFNEFDQVACNDVFTRYSFRLQLGDAKGGYTAVIRILDRNSNVAELANLNFDPWTYNNLVRMSNTSAGLVLITGPTGSGKTTSLYAALKEIDPVERSIQTIENPVEYRHGLWMQYEISRTAKVEGGEWGKMLKGLLRNAPKVILMGEVRDAETAKTLIEAANTGHLVFTTLHTNTSSMAIARMKKLEVDMDSLAGELLGVLAQRLTRRLCPHCKIEDTSEETKKTLDPIHRPYLASLPNITPMKANPRGCKICNYTGYSGRNIVYELLVVTKKVRQLIETGANTSTIAAEGIKPGYSMWDCGLKLVAQGITSLEALRLVVQDEQADDFD